MRGAKWALAHHQIASDRTIHLHFADSLATSVVDGHPVNEILVDVLDDSVLLA
jgi:hypothetical protein